MTTTVGFHNGGRDLTGFIDGTQNPDTSLRTVVAQATATTAAGGAVSTGSSSYLGSSFVFVSKFVHDLSSFRALCPHKQSEVIGRERQREQPQKGSDGRSLSDNPRPLRGGLSNFGGFIRDMVHFC